MKQFNILIIDDDPDDHFFVKSAIREFGSNISLISVYDGTQGLNYLGISESNLIHKKFPDLILCDINMPFMSGMDFLEAIKSDDHYKNIPVCMFTTSCDDETKAKLVALGALDCVTKPMYAANYNTILANIFNKLPAFDNL
ncbi:MAG: response regulator [Bacteroidia bacterium]